MTAGNREDFRPENYRAGAWPRKLEMLLQHIWPNVTVENIARGGADEVHWLNNFHVIKRMEPFDLLIGEFAVNDQCNYDKKEVSAAKFNHSSHFLLNEILWLPNKPAVLLIELFRTAHTNQNDAKAHCQDHRNVTADRSWYCPQWWLPQTWREQATEYNKVPAASYRDAVWPIQNDPPGNLLYYWDGLSHPRRNGHVFVAEMVLYSLLFLRQSTSSVSLATQINDNSGDGPPRLVPPNAVCEEPATAYPWWTLDNKNLTHHFNESTSADHCWSFGAYSRKKMGWIGNVTKQPKENVSSTCLLQTKIQFGPKNNLLVTHLKSYDERMGTARIWFDDEPEFSWNISSWQQVRTSVPETTLIVANHLPRINQMVTMNLELLAGSAHAPRSLETRFILLGITTC